MPSVLIVIPARYQSTRLPGKPLRVIRGVPMIERVARIAAAVCGRNPACTYVVATDHPAISDFCTKKSIPVVMTPEQCSSGTERCREAVRQQTEKPDFVINLQGDNPLCPPHIIQGLIDAWNADPTADVYTPAVHLDWDDYERMLEAKKVTPYSGTTVAMDRNRNALFFSKTVIPSIRDAQRARKELGDKSPVWRHIGLYAYTAGALERYFELDSPYEKGWIEGLEQLRFLYNGMTVRVVEADYRGRRTTSGVDSEEDIARVESILDEFGDPENETASENKTDPTPPRRLIIVRHGNTFRPEETPRRVGGRTDLPLVEDERAKNVARVLAEHNYRPDRILAAPLLRTMQTAKIIARELGCDMPVLPAADFMEIDYGPDEDRPEQDVIERIGRASLQAMNSDPELARDSVVEQGKKTLARWDTEGVAPPGWHVDVEAIRQTWTTLGNDVKTGETVLVVSSNGIIRFAPSLLAEGEEIFRSRHSIKVTTGGVCVFENDGSGWRCVLWNAR